MKTITFKDFELTINLTPFINIIGSNGGGKTTLLKTMINQNSSSDVLIDDKDVSEYDIDFLRKNVAAVLNNFSFKTDYVKEELMYYQQILGIEVSIANKNIQKFCKFFELDELIEAKIENLSKYEQAFIKILSLLIINPTILGIDGMLEYLNVNQKLKIIKYAKNNGISILNVTSNPEELLFGTDIIILDNNRVVVYDSTRKVLSNDKFLTKIEMNEPFIVEMSNNLNYYDLLSKKYFNLESLVGELWK